MKKIIYLFFCTVLIYSCTTQEPDIFSSSPAERLSEVLVADNLLLTSAGNGWVMEYFAIPTTPGYPLLVKFNASGSATFAAKSELTKNKEFETDSCLFEMIGDNGPVLTFNTYNKVLHRFSDPTPDGNGLEGDYEFVVMKADSNQIILKGKKSSSLILLNKLPLNISWTKYIEDLEQMNNILFANNAPKLTMKIGTSVYTFSKGVDHIFSIVKEGAVVNNIDAPFIITHSGIRLYSELELDGNKFQNFVLNDDKSALVSTDNPEIKISGPDDLGLFFVSNIIRWEFDPTALSATVKSYYDGIVQACTEKYNAQDVKLALKYYSNRKTFVLSLSFLTGGTRNEGNIDMTINTSGKNGLTILYKGTADINGAMYYSDIQPLKDLTSLLSNSFSLSTFVKINPQSIKLTRKTDATTWITLVRK
ncbi:MAG: DUF4302 domain-containing protein [Paludibacter sp.]|nr:DUF4302 domain-containing protein [Paludibacter sp.]